jgi:hypothetical protein
MREDLVQGNRPLDIKVMLPMWTKGFPVDNSSPLGRLVGHITLNECSLNLARLDISSVSLLNHKRHTTG